MKMENQGNPWGMSNATRGDWSAKVDGIEIVEPGDAFDHEYLYWVGCAGSFDDKNQKVSEAMAKLMRRAGLDSAILGSNDLCPGAPPRRPGHEYISQVRPMPNIQTLTPLDRRLLDTNGHHSANP